MLKKRVNLLSFLILFPHQASSCIDYNIWTLRLGFHKILNTDYSLIKVTYIIQAWNLSNQTKSDLIKYSKFISSIDLTYRFKTRYKNMF